jgi:hypothetical protein
MDHDSDKDPKAVDHIEKSHASVSDEVDDYDEQEAKKIVQRIDRRLLVTIGFMYCVSLIDRTNISAAAIAGLLQDLKLTGNRYVSSPSHWSSIASSCS